MAKDKPNDDAGDKPQAAAPAVVDTPATITAVNPADATDEARAKVREDAWFRQQSNKPARPKRQFFVGNRINPNWPEGAVRVTADNEIDAIAVYNDARTGPESMKNPPSPKMLRVELAPPKVEKPAA